MLSFFKKVKVIKKTESKFDIKLIGLVLAYEIARSDGDIDDSELTIILRKISKLSKETNKEEKEILFIVKKYAEDNVSFNDFINDINNEFSYEEKLKLIKFLWSIAYADNLLEVNEERLIRRIADLINIKDIKVLKLKNDAKNKN